MLPLERAASPLTDAKGAPTNAGDGSADGLRIAAKAFCRAHGCRAFGIFNLVMACIPAVCWKEFSPVYKRMECMNQTATIDQLDLTISGVTMGMQIQVQCTNPNPYAIKIVQSTPGRVFVKIDGERMEIGDLKVVPGSKLPEKSEGNIRVRMDTKLTGEEADAIGPHFLQDRENTVLMELQLTADVSPVVWGIPFPRVDVPFKKKCGLHMAGLLVNQNLLLPSDATGPALTRLGPLNCSSSFDDMYIPPVGEVSETPADGHMGFSAAQVAPAKVAMGEKAKDVGCLIGFALCLFLGIGSLTGQLQRCSWPNWPSCCPEAKPSAIARSTTKEDVASAVEGGRASSATSRGDPDASGFANGGVTGRSPRGLASSIASWPHPLLEQLHRMVSRSMSPVRVAAARYFPAASHSPPSSPNVRDQSAGLDFGPYVSQLKAQLQGDPLGSPLENARRQLRIPVGPPGPLGPHSKPGVSPSPRSRQSSPGPPRAPSPLTRPSSPAIPEEARARSKSRERDPYSHLSSRQTSRRSHRKEVQKSPRPRAGHASPRSRGDGTPMSTSWSHWPQAPQVPTDSRESAGSAGAGLRGLPQAAMAAGRDDRSRDAEGLSTPNSRLPPRLPPLSAMPSPPVSSRSSAPYASPATSPVAA